LKNRYWPYLLPLFLFAARPAWAHGGISDAFRIALFIFIWLFAALFVWGIYILAKKQKTGFASILRMVFIGLLAVLGLMFLVTLVSMFGMAQ
jgi:hypothetical protein